MRLLCLSPSLLDVAVAHVGRFSSNCVARLGGAPFTFVQCKVSTLDMLEEVGQASVTARRVPVHTCTAAIISLLFIFIDVGR